MTFAFDIITHSALAKKFKVSTAWKVPVFGAILVRIFPHSDWIRMRENADQNNSEYQHFLRSDSFMNLIIDIFLIANSSFKIDDKKSPDCHGNHIKCVPQSSILGPTLFNIYVIGLTDHLKLLQLVKQKKNWKRILNQLKFGQMVLIFSIAKTK